MSRDEGAPLAALLAGSARERDADLPSRAWFVATCGLFVVTHLATDRAAAVLGLSHAQNQVAWLRGVLFAALAVAVLWPLGRELRAACRRAAPLLRRSFGLACATFVLTCALVVPNRGTNGITSLGIQYARYARDPFHEPYSWFHKRLLLPALAWLVPSSHPRVLWAVGLVVAFVGVLALAVFVEAVLERAGGDPERPLVRLPLHLALATCNPVVFAFAAPGYPEMLGVALVLFAFSLDLSGSARAGLVAVALLSHEAVLFAAVPLAVVALRGRARYAVLSVCALYVVAWLACGVGAMSTETARQMRPEGMPAWWWLAQYPGRAAHGVLTAHKAMWLAPVLAAWLAPSVHRARLGLALVVLAPLATLPITVDTSRLTGLGIAGIAASAAIVWREAERSARARRLSWALILATLVWPSTYVGLNAGEHVATGIYAVVRTGDLFAE